MRRLSLWMALAAMTALVVTAACRKQETPPPAGEPSAQQGGAPPTPVAPPDSAQGSGSAGIAAPAGSAAKIPEGFPTDVPVYAGTAVTDAAADQSASGAGFTLKLESADPVDTVFAWYLAELPKVGWTKSLEVPAPGGRSAFFKQGNRTVSIKAVPAPLSPGKTAIDIIVSEDRTEGPARP